MLANRGATASRAPTQVCAGYNKSIARSVIFKNNI